jgi:hypothetical protein
VNLGEIDDNLVVGEIDGKTAIYAAETGRIYPMPDGWTGHVGADAWLRDLARSCERMLK